MLAGLLACLSPPVSAELSVTSAKNVPELTVGKALVDDHVFELSENAELSLHHAPAGTQFEMRGPYKGTLEKFLKDCKGWLAFQHAYCKQQSAGDQLPIGGTRGPTK